jgi:hypothetical protein
MSPRRRGRGRVTGGAAVAGPGAVAGSGAAPGVAPQPSPIDGTSPDSGAPSATLIPPSTNGTRHSANGARPTGAGNAGGPRPGVLLPRRQPRIQPQPIEVGEELVGPKAGCTLAQMRRFIKSRPYVPVHELRRRFLIEGIEDEVSPVTTDKGMLYVGLPEREAAYLGELIKAGDVGCELLLDPTSPAVIGVFPMRPIARQ